MAKQRIGIFASGTGSNALNLIRSFKDHDSLEVALVLSNVETAPVLKASHDLGIPIFYMSNGDVANGGLFVRSVRIKNWIGLYWLGISE